MLRAPCPEPWRAVGPGPRPASPGPSEAQTGSRTAPGTPRPPGDWEEAGGGRKAGDPLRRSPQGWESERSKVRAHSGSEHLESEGCAAGGCKSRSRPRGAVVYSRVRIAVRVGARDRGGAKKESPQANS